MAIVVYVLYITSKPSYGLVISFDIILIIQQHWDKSRLLLQGHNELVLIPAPQKKPRVVMHPFYLIQRLKVGTVIRKIHTNPSLFITVPYSLTVYCRSVVPLLRLAVLCKCHTGVTGGQTCSACDTALEVVIEGKARISLCYLLLLEFNKGL